MPRPQPRASSQSHQLPSSGQEQMHMKLDDAPTHQFPLNTKCLMDPETNHL